MRRRKSSKAVPRTEQSSGAGALLFITPKTSESGEAPWRTMFQKVSSERSSIRACNEILVPCSDVCTCVIVDVTILNPEEILLALEANGLYDITEERNRHSIQL